MKVVIPGKVFEAENIFGAYSDLSIPQTQTIMFAGGIDEEKKSGTTAEELMAILISKLKFDATQLPCKETSCAITHIQEATFWLQERKRDRIERGVEGTNNR